MLNLAPIKFNQLVWHDQPYLHPMQRINVGPDFYDRAAEKAAIKAHLHSPDCAPLLILGERRSGKTSLLKLLDNYMTNDSAGKFMSVCNIWVGFKSCRDLIEEIWQEIQIQRRKITGPDQPFAGPKPATTAELLEALRSLPFERSQKLVIAIDELDSYLNEAQDIAPAEGPLFEALIKGLMEASDLPVQLLITATCLPADLTAGMISLRLHPFNAVDLAELVRGITDATAANLSDDDLAGLFELSGGWPWWVKLLLLCLNEAGPGEDRLSRAASLAVRHPNVGPLVENVYFYHFDKEEKALVLALSQQRGCFKAAQVAAMPAPRQTALADLVERDYLQRDWAGDCRFKIGLLADWFLMWNRFEEEKGLYAGPVALD